MKAYVIKNKEEKYRGNSYIGEVRDIRHAEIYDTLKEIILNDGEEVVEITIAEGDLEEENRILKRALELATDNCDNYWEEKDALERKMSLYDYFIEQAIGEKDA